MRLMLNEERALMTEEEEEAQLSNGFFDSLFADKAGPQEPQSLRTRERVWRVEDSRLVDEGQRSYV